MMKKLPILLLSMILAFALTACSSGGDSAGDGGNGASSETAPDGSVIETVDGAAEKAMTDPNAEVSQIVTIYHGDDGAAGVKQSLDGLDGDAVTAEGLVEKLVEYGVLDQGTEVLDFSIDGKTGTLDLSQIPQKSGTEEQIMLISIGNTFTENFELDQLKLLVGGGNYGSQGDEDYLTYVSKYKTLGQ